MYTPQVSRRLVFVLAVAGLLLAMAWWAQRADGARLGAWSPPRLIFGKDTRPDAAVATEEDGREWGVVSCVVDPSLGEKPGRLVATESEGNGVVVSTTAGRELSLVLPPGDWKVSWHANVEGRRAEVRRVGIAVVEAGNVDRCRIEGSGWTLGGQVTDLDGEPTPGAWVEGCGEATTTDEAGRYSLLTQNGDCLLRAWSRDGELRRPGEAEYFDAFAPPAAINLRVNVDPIGGLGMGLATNTDGLSVVFVADESPAAAAGIVAGDLVVAVDGVSAAGWSTLRGVQSITGDPGTRVAIRVRSEGGEERELSLERARIAEAEPAVADTGSLLAP